MKGLIDIRSLVPAAISLLVAAVAIGISSDILANIGGTTSVESMVNRSNITSELYNVTHEGIGAMNTFADYLTTIAIVIVAAVVIGVILTSFVFKQQ